MKLFVFEGIDFSGKSTYFEYIKKIYRNSKDYFFVKEPWEKAKTYNILREVLEKKKKIDEIELKKLFARARNELFDYLIEKNYKYVFLDRSILSNFAYFFDNNLSFDDFCSLVGEKYKDIILNKNNVLFLFIVEKEDLIKRMKERKILEHYEKTSILLKVQEKYLRIYRSLDMKKFLFDTSKESIEEIKNKIISILKKEIY